MHPHARLINECLVELSKQGCLVWRNETGAGYFSPRKDIRNVSYMRYGLCPGSADIIGIAPDGKFLAVECKTGSGRPNKDQAAFIEKVKNNNGIAFIARSAQNISLADIA